MWGGECIQLFGRETCRKRDYVEEDRIEMDLKYAGGHGLALSCRGEGQLVGLCGWYLTFEFCKYVEFRLVNRELFALQEGLCCVRLLKSPSAPPFSLLEMLLVFAE